MKKLQLAVLFGGCSPEYGVSLQSAHAVLTHLDPEKYAVIPIGITRLGAWRLFRGDFDQLLDDSWTAASVPCCLSPDRGAGYLRVEDVPETGLHLDAAFPVLHGRNGEDGTVQGLLELAGIPIVGCGVLASALCMDKNRAHKLAAQAGLRVPVSFCFSRGVSPEAVARAAEDLGYPLFVKPVRAGSSFGITRVEAPGDLERAVAEALQCDDEVLLEEAIPGFEVGCAILGTGETLTVGLLDEIELAGGFFDFTEKYNLITSQIHVPARISPALTRRVKDAAVAAYRALGCQVFARVDQFVTPAGEIVFNEINTIPGFTRHSRYPSMMAGIGLEFPALLDRMVRLAVGV